MIWFAAVFALLFALLALAVLVLRAPISDALVALQLASGLFALILLLLAQAYQRASFADLGLAVALLSVPSGLLFAHFFERWL
ncbi:monovalent cation/H+ antiporter complex subunit F [Lichenicoccus sp.]|uniref:monovalent cation/H+ antiporter complex subunit F n=1 Tax=Lichenicoccus sp. TaxID=2781899 RepID=UPI003D0A812D